VSFQISALPVEPFRHLIGRPAETLAAHAAARLVADRKPGFPCRVSLVDAEIGESVLLVNYEHLPAASPYRSRYAIYVRENAIQAHPGVDEVPQQLRLRLLSVRAFDAAAMLLEADVMEGTTVERTIERMFDNPRVACLHLHNAKAGRYAARVDRA
jgi:uncharacterized protein DUF1203